MIFLVLVSMLNFFACLISRHIPITNNKGVLKGINKKIRVEVMFPPENNPPPATSPKTIKRGPADNESTKKRTMIMNEIIKYFDLGFIYLSLGYEMEVVNSGLLCELLINQERVDEAHYAEG